MNSFHPVDIHDISLKVELSDRLIRSVQHLGLIPKKRLVDILANHEGEQRHQHSTALYVRSVDDVVPEHTFAKNGNR